MIDCANIQSFTPHRVNRSVLLLCRLSIIFSLIALVFILFARPVLAAPESTPTPIITTVPLQGIILSVGGYALAPGNSAELYVMYTPEDATNKAVTWTSSNPELVTVEPTGIGTAKITALEESTGSPVTITATSEEGNFTASCNVSIMSDTPTPTGVTLSSASLELAVGETARLSATVFAENGTVISEEMINQSYYLLVFWESDNNIVSIDSSGKITALNTGTTTVTITIFNERELTGFTASCDVTILPRKTIHLNKQSEIYQLTPMELPEDGSALVWSSSAPSIVSVSQDGVVTAVSGGGSAIITVTSEGGDYLDSYLIAVEELPLAEHALLGTGTAANPYLISTADDLAQFRDIVNAGYTNAWGVLTQDIDLSQLTDEAERENWTPIGYSPYFNETEAYIGMFDGLGHEISNLKINKPKESYIGLFGYVYPGGVIKGLSVSGTVTGGRQIGGIVGANYGTVMDCKSFCNVIEAGNTEPYLKDQTGGIIGKNSGAVMNCANIGSVSGREMLGGIVGENGIEGIVINCINTGIITGTRCVGGIAGDNDGTVTNCNNSGTVNNNSGNLYTGGIVGYNYGHNGEGTISNCSNSGDVSATSNLVGGIVGSNSSGLVMNCHNTGAVTGNGEIGGIAGENYGTLTNSSNSGTVIGTGEEIGGIAGNNYVYHCTISNCSNSGNVSGSSNVGGVAGYNYSDSSIVINSGWRQGSQSVGVAANPSGTITNVVQFTSSQQVSVVTAAIPSIDKTTLYADKSEIATISFTTYPSEPSNRFNAASGFMRNLKAESDSPDIVSVVSVTQSSGTVILRAQGSGTAKITVTADLYATNFASIGSYVTEPVQAEFVYYIDVVIPLEGISLSETDITLVPDSSTKLSVIYSPEDATNKAVTWISSNPDLVRVEPTVINGVVRVTALELTEEPVTITATTVDGNYTASANVMVQPSTQPIATKIVTESGKCPSFCTLLTGSTDSSSAVEYPGTAVSDNGTVYKTILSQDSDYYLGVSLLSTLVSGMKVSPDAEDFTDSPLYMVEGDLNSDNVIDGTDYTILVQRMHYDSGLSDYGLVGDLNYDDVVDDQDLMFFNSPVTHTGEPRFMMKGYDMTGGTAETRTTATDSYTAARSSALQIEPAVLGSYEVSFKEATEPANMLQLALAGDIYNAVPSLPEGYELIGEHYDDGRTTVAIGNTAKDGVPIPAGTPILSVQSASEPRIDYTHSALQKATEAGIVDLPLTGGSSSLIDVPTPAAPVRQPSSGGSSGCNMGLGVFALLAALPLFFTRKR